MGTMRKSCLIRYNQDRLIEHFVAGTPLAINRLPIILAALEWLVSVEFRYRPELGSGSLIYLRHPVIWRRPALRVLKSRTE